MSFLHCTRRLLIPRPSLLVNNVRHGFIVLVPEIGEESTDKNPLIREDGLPEFTNISVEKCIAVIGKQSSDVENTVKLVEEQITKNVTNGNIIKEVLDPLEPSSVTLETTWGLAKVLYLGNSTLMPTKSYLSIHDRARRARSAKFNSLIINKHIQAVEKNANKLTEDEARLLKKFSLEGKLNGVSLSESKHNHMNEVINKLSQERAKFKGKTDISTKSFVHNIDNYNIVRDFPSNLLQAMASDPSKPTEGPWKLTLQPHVYAPFLEYCPNRNLRWNAWQAETRRGSGYMNKDLDNSTHLELIRDLRQQQATLLGYKNYMEMSMETKMAGSVENVKQVFANLMEKARPMQEQELKLLTEFANTEGGFKGELDFYDIPYYRRKLLKSHFKYDEEALKEYFPLPNVQRQMFALSEKLFNIKIEERQGVDKWHGDVKYYDVFDLTDGGSKPIAGFYTDFYSRKDEKLYLEESPGWMIGIRNRSKLAETTPLAAIIFNLDVPMYGKPTLLNLKEVEVLFHKFGHALQQLLTRCEYNELAGHSNVEWDAVEVSGHLMTNLLRDSNVIKSISSHFTDEEQLSDELIKSINDCRRQLAAFDLCRELYLSDLDIELHTSKEFWGDVVKKVWPMYNAIPMDKRDAHPCSMTHIFSGDWGGAYYSRIWAKFVAADVYGAFKETNGSEEKLLEVGTRFRETFLALGGSRSPGEVFRRFRGRDPSASSLLHVLGIDETSKL